MSIQAAAVNCCANVALSLPKNVVQNRDGPLVSAVNGMEGNGLAQVEPFLVAEVGMRKVLDEELGREQPWFVADVVALEDGGILFSGTRIGAGGAVEGFLGELYIKMLRFAGPFLYPAIYERDR